MPDQMQAQRFERKFFISAAKGKMIREYVRQHLVPDEYSASRPDYAYSIHNIYLDSDELSSYWATLQGEVTRFKLRIRFYDENPQSPVFFEIKRRVGECILKKRGAVHRIAAPELIAGQLPEGAHLPGGDAKTLATVQRFCLLMQQMRASPKMHIAYEREAWMSKETNSVRVTMDRMVRGEERYQMAFTKSMQRPAYPFGKLWVLELKFTNRYPGWFNNLVQRFDLLETGAAKYCGSIQNLGSTQYEEGWTPASKTSPQSVLKYF